MIGHNPVIKVRSIDEDDEGFEFKDYGDSALVVDKVIQSTWRPISVSANDLCIIQNMMDEVFKLGKSARSDEINELLGNRHT